MWEIARGYCGRPLIPGKDIIYFPICDDPVKWPPKRAKETSSDYSIPENVIDVFEQVQPYHAGYEPISWLPLLGNEDKHRLPVLTTIVADHFDVELRYKNTPIGRAVNVGVVFVPTPYSLPLAAQTI